MKENNELINKKLEEQFNKMKEKLEEENSNNFVCCNICFEDKDPYYMVKCPNEQHYIGCLDCAGQHLKSKLYTSTPNIGCPYCRTPVIKKFTYNVLDNNTYDVKVIKEKFEPINDGWVNTGISHIGKVRFEEYEENDNSKYTLNFTKEFTFLGQQRNRKKMKIKVNERQFNDIRNFDYFKKKIYINKYEEDGVKYRWSFIQTMEKYKLTDYFKLMEIKPLIDFERIRKYCREFNEEFDTFKRYHLTE